MNTNRRTKPSLQRLEEIENTRKEGEQNQNAMEGDVQTVPLIEAFSRQCRQVLISQITQVSRALEVFDGNKSGQPEG